MFCLSGLSLLYAASFLQSSAMADEVVTLKCVSVSDQAQNTVTLNCSINSTLGVLGGIRYVWYEDKEETCSSNGTQENCRWDEETYVSLTIHDVVKEQKYTVCVEGIHGRDSFSITVPAIGNNVKEGNSSRAETTIIGPVASNNGRKDSPAEMATHEKVLWFTCIPFIALGLLFFLLLFFRQRQKDAIRKINTQGDYSITNNPA